MLTDRADTPNYVTMTYKKIYTVASFKLAVLINTQDYGSTERYRGLYQQIDKL